MGYFRLKEGAEGKLGEPGVGDNEAPEGTADIIRKKDIDFEGMINDIKKEREKIWDSAQEDLKNGKKPSLGIFSSFDPSISREDFVNKTSGIAPYSILLHGEWISRGKMGWFGCSKDEISAEEWDKKFMDIVEKEDDDTMFTVVDCHI